MPFKTQPEVIEVGPPRFVQEMGDLDASFLGSNSELKNYAQKFEVLNPEASVEDASASSFTRIIARQNGVESGEIPEAVEIERDAHTRTHTHTPSLTERAVTGAGRPYTG